MIHELPLHLKIFGFNGESSKLNLPSPEARDSHLDSYLARFGTNDILSPKVSDPDRPPLLGCFLNESLMGETPKTALVRLFNVHGRTDRKRI
ncbi:MAG: hypothetical protein QNJ70_08095 [Xenococcaceae cyanobacterium MO_207.B15]|nr:hypothetical protein [Xenococcaceae cyanobacterium MO_207.B15]